MNEIITNAPSLNSNSISDAVSNNSLSMNNSISESFNFQQLIKYGLVDFPHKNEATKQAWLDYRKQLRDLTKNSTPLLDNNGILTNVIWSTAPS